MGNIKSKSKIHGVWKKPKPQKNTCTYEMVFLGLSLALSTARSYGVYHSSLPSAFLLLNPTGGWGSIVVSIRTTFCWSLLVFMWVRLGLRWGGGTCCLEDARMGKREEEEDWSMGLSLEREEGLKGERRGKREEEVEIDVEVWDLVQWYYVYVSIHLLFYL